MSVSHRMTFAKLASLRQVDDKSLQKFMDRFGRIAIQIHNLNPKVVLHSMILTKRPDKWKKCPVRQDGQKCNKREGSTKTDSHKLDKRHKPDKHQPLLKRPWYECYTPLTTNHTTILEEAFNLEVPIRLPPMHPPRSGFHRSIGHNTKECWTLKDKIEELIHPNLLSGWTTTKQERDIEDTKRISIGITTLQGINLVNQDDPMVVSIIIANFIVSKVLIDQISPNTIQPHKGISRDPRLCQPNDHLRSRPTNQKLYNQKSLNELEAIVSTPHLKMKFPTLAGEIVTIKADQKQAQHLKVAPYPHTGSLCPIVDSTTHVISIDERSLVRALTFYQASIDNEFDLDSCNDTSDRGPKLVEELIKLQLGPKPGQLMQLSSDLNSHEHKRIADVLQKNMDLFAWQPSDMLRIHPSIIFHKFAIYPQANLISQKKRKMGEERCKAVRE
ncbi:hypothetical protein HKD37_17G048707 [Glycine soja]